METTYRRRQPASRLEQLLAGLLRAARRTPVQVDLVLAADDVEFRRA